MALGCLSQYISSQTHLKKELLLVGQTIRAKL